MCVNLCVSQHPCPSSSSAPYSLWGCGCRWWASRGQRRDTRAGTADQRPVRGAVGTRDEQGLPCLTGVSDGAVKDSKRAPAAGRGGVRTAERQTSLPGNAVHAVRAAAGAACGPCPAPPGSSGLRPSAALPGGGGSVRVGAAGGGRDQPALNTDQLSSVSRSAWSWQHAPRAAGSPHHSACLSPSRACGTEHPGRTCEGRSARRAAKTSCFCTFGRR